MSKQTQFIVKEPINNNVTEVLKEKQEAISFEEKEEVIVPSKKEKLINRLSNIINKLMEEE